MRDREMSIVIPSLNSVTVDRTLDSLRAQTRPLTDAEIIVVGLDEPGLVTEDRITRFISTGEPVSAAAARNIGMGEATGRYLLFIDSDCVAAPDWVDRLMEPHMQNEEVVGGGVAFLPDGYWALADNVSRFHEFLVGGKPGYRRYLPTLSLSVSRKVARQVGGFDERLPGAAGEDVDWTIRITKLGYRLYFEPRAIVYHQPSRIGVNAVLEHWLQSGHNMSRVRLRHADVLRAPFLLRSRLGMLSLSPIISLYVTGAVFVRNRSLVRYLHTLPAVFLTKMAWCLGASRQVRLMSNA